MSKPSVSVVLQRSMTILVVQRLHDCSGGVHTTYFRRHASPSVAWFLRQLVLLSQVIAHLLSLYSKRVDEGTDAWSTS